MYVGGWLVNTTVYRLLRILSVLLFAIGVLIPSRWGLQAMSLSVFVWLFGGFAKRASVKGASGGTAILVIQVLVFASAIAVFTVLLGWDVVQHGKGG